MRAPLIAAACVAVLVLAGCGEDDSDGSAASTDIPDTLTRAEYIERADAVCQELYEQRDPLEVQAAEAGQAGDAEAAAQIFENAVGITANHVTELEALPIPAGEEEALGVFLARARATIPPAEQAVEALSDENSANLGAASRRGARANTRFNKYAIDYGFLVCGRGAATEIG